MQILPVLTEAQLPIVHNVFGLGTFPDTMQAHAHEDNYENMIQWLRNRVQFLHDAIQAGNEFVLPYINEINVAACNAELDGGSLTLCGVTLTVQNS
jgi:cob(I)alamin adenosyltransferase